MDDHDKSVTASACVRGPARAKTRPTWVALALAATTALAACSQPSTAEGRSAPVAATVTPSPASSATSPTGASRTPAVSPSLATPASAAAPPSLPTPEPSPELTITCPDAGTSDAATFSHTVSAAPPYTVAIDYGDGHAYSGDDQHLSAVFSHTYSTTGSFDVSVQLTDTTGQETTATCTWTRTASVAASATGTTGSGDTGGASGGSDYYTNSDGSQVHRPEAAPAAPAGATARCRDGEYSFSQHRSGTCSHHGGVATWL